MFSSAYNALSSFLALLVSTHPLQLSAVGHLCRGASPNFPTSPDLAHSHLSQTHCISLFTLPTQLLPLLASSFLKHDKPSPISDYAHALTSGWNILSPHFLMDFLLFRYGLKSHLGEAFPTDWIKCSYHLLNNFFFFFCTASLFFHNIYRSSNLFYAHMFYFHRQNLILDPSFSSPTRRWFLLYFSNKIIFKWGVADFVHQGTLPVSGDIWMLQLGREGRLLAPSG